MKTDVPTVEGFLYEIVGLSDLIKEIKISEENEDIDPTDGTTRKFNYELGEYIYSIMSQEETELSDRFSLYYDRLLDMIALEKDIIEIYQKMNVLTTLVDNKGYVIIITNSWSKTL